MLNGNKVNIVNMYKQHINNIHIIIIPLIPYNACTYF